MKVILIISIFIFGFISGNIFSSKKEKVNKHEIVQELDSLKTKIKDKELEIKALKSNVDFWGNMYDKCKGFK